MTMACSLFWPSCLIDYLAVRKANAKAKVIPGAVHNGNFVLATRDY